MENFSLADIGAMIGNREGGLDGFGGSGAWVLIILFALIFGWGGNGFGNRNAAPVEPVTEAGLCNSMNFNNLQNAVGRLSDNQAAIARQTDNAICQLGYQNAQLSNQSQRDMCQGFATVNSNINQARFDAEKCCCATQRAIDGVNYNAAMNTAAINANTTAQTQKVLDAICQNKIDSLQAQVSELKMQGMFCGIPRISPYGFGVVPQFANCGNCCGNI